MSIDWLFDLERDIENGKEIYACPTVGRDAWVLAKSKDDLMKVAQRAADHKKLPVSIVRIVSVHDTISGDQFLVPINIGDPGIRGEPNIKWKEVDTKEAAEMMRDVRHGPSPCFGITLEEKVEPKVALE